MKKEITDILINNRSIKFGDLINPTYGVDIKSKHKTFPELVVALDEIMSVLDFFEDQGYIEIKKIFNNSEKGKHYFDGIVVETRNEKAEITANKMHWFVEEVNKRYLYEITIKSGLIKYRDDGYKTSKDVEWNRQIILTIGAVLLTSILSWFVQYLLADNNINCFIKL